MQAMSSPFTLGTFAHGLAKQSRLAVMRHTSRGVSQPVFDRYSTIRTFFKNQLRVAGSHDTLSQRWHNRGLLESRIVITGIRAEFGAHVKWRKHGPFTRQFHACSWRSVEGNVPSNQRLKEQVLPDENSAPQPRKPPNTVEGSSDPTTPPHDYANYPRYVRRLALSLPHLHRPTRDELLNVANGFWQRTRIRFKWFTIKSFRKFNADDISAFVTWFLMSQALWIFIGTWVSYYHILGCTLNSVILQHNVLLYGFCYGK